VNHFDPDTELADRRAKRVPVTTTQLRRIRWMVEKASRGVHSNARMANDERRAILGFLAVAKRELDTCLQLELFSESQLDL